MNGFFNKRIMVEWASAWISYLAGCGRKTLYPKSGSQETQTAAYREGLLSEYNMEWMHDMDPSTCHPPPNPPPLRLPPLPSPPPLHLPPAPVPELVMRCFKQARRCKTLGGKRVALQASSIRKWKLCGLPGRGPKCIYHTTAATATAATLYLAGAARRIYSRLKSTADLLYNFYLMYRPYCISWPSNTGCGG